MSKFQPGDRVILIDDKAPGAFDNVHLHNGMTGIITEEKYDSILPGWISVAWDQNVRGHTCGGCAEDGHGWRTHEDSVELMEPMPVINESDIMEVLYG